MIKGTEYSRMDDDLKDEMNTAIIETLKDNMVMLNRIVKEHEQKIAKLEKDYLSLI